MSRRIAVDPKDIAARGRRHYDAVKAALDAAEADLGKPALGELHRALGEAWDEFRKTFAGEYGDRSGGTDKPEEDDDGRPAAPPRG